jgi:aspartate-semialdehyde dehydrogenase
MKQMISVGVVGATGMVGKLIIELLEGHPFFQVEYIAASQRSAGKVLGEFLSEQEQHRFSQRTRALVLQETLMGAEDLPAQKKFGELGIRVLFLAATLSQEEALEVYHRYLSLGILIFSCHSAWRMNPLVPILLPAINSQDLKLLDRQRNELKLPSGAGIVCKSNCTIQGMAGAVTPLLHLVEPEMEVVHLQSASGAGRLVDEWPELQKNILPHIAGEEEKSQHELQKVWNGLGCNSQIQATSLRVSVDYGHLSIVTLHTKQDVSPQQILDLWQETQLHSLEGLKMTPKQYLCYHQDPLDLSPHQFFQRHDPMSIAIGRLQVMPGRIRFLTLTHNLILGAAGSAIWGAELCYCMGVLLK